MSLTEQDRDAICEAIWQWDESPEQTVEDHVLPVIEAIVARHIEAFRAEVVAAIEATADCGADCKCDTCDVLRFAASLVAHQQPPTPPEATALRVEGGGGR
ncbi:MAG: hypothetical protein ACXVGA_06780 [Mycobacteriaceae bacterium]